MSKPRVDVVIRDYKIANKTTEEMYGGLTTMREHAQAAGAGLRLNVDTAGMSDGIVRRFIKAHGKMVPYTTGRLSKSVVQVNSAKLIYQSGGIVRVSNPSCYLGLTSGWWRFDIDHNLLSDDPFQQMGDMWGSMGGVKKPGALCILTSPETTDADKVAKYNEYLEMLCKKYDKKYIYDTWGSAFWLDPVTVIIKDANSEFNADVSQASGFTSIEDERINGFSLVEYNNQVQVFTNGPGEIVEVPNGTYYTTARTRGQDRPVRVDLDEQPQAHLFGTFQEYTDAMRRYEMGVGETEQRRAQAHQLRNLRYNPDTNTFERTDGETLVDE